MPTRPAQLTRIQFERALCRLNPAYAYSWHDDNVEYDWRGVDTGEDYEDAPIPSDATIIAAWGAQDTEDQAEVTAQAAVATDRSNFDQAYDQAIADLTTLSNSGNTTFTTAQLSNFMRRNAQIWLKVLPLAKRLRDRDL